MKGSFAMVNEKIIKENLQMRGIRNVVRIY
jgi:hypothetical protein